jgi:hypothetical protein
MAASIRFLLPLLALATIPAYTQTMAFEEHRPAAPPAVSEFAINIDRYMEVHRLLGNPMSSLTALCGDPEQAMRAREAHREAVVEARIATPRGDIFTPRVAAYVRRLILMAERHAEVAGTDVKTAALERLPRLPIELEYRLVDRDLVLLDKEIDVVVDVLYEALPPEPLIDWEETCSGS